MGTRSRQIRFVLTEPPINELALGNEVSVVTRTVH